MKDDINIIFEKVAKQFGLPRYEVAKIVTSMCGYIFDLMEEGEWEGFYMRYFGRFIVKPKRLETMQKKLKEKQKRELESFEEDPLDFS